MNTENHESIAVPGNSDKPLKKIDQAEDFLDLLLFIQVGIIIIDCLTKNIIFINNKAASIIGTTPDGLVGEKCYDRICIEKKGVCPVCDLNLTMNNKEEILIKSDGSYCQVLKSVQPFIFKGKLSVLESFFDISGRKHREKRTELLNKLQTDLVKPGTIEKKIRNISRTITESSNIDFAFIWLLRPGDLCNKGCVHGKTDLSKEHCIKEKKCFHLISKPNQNPGTDDEFKRIPYGSLDLAYFFADSSGKFIINNLESESSIDIKKLVALGIKSLASFRLSNSQGESNGLLTLFSKRSISSEIESYLESIANLTSQIIINANSEEALKKAMSRTEQANALMEGREIRIRRLKEEVNSLSGILGRKKKYKTTIGDTFNRDTIDVTPEESKNNALSLAEDAEIARREAVEINEQLSLIKQAIDSSSDAVAISTVTGNFFYINKTFTDLLGYEISGLAMLPIEQLFVDEENFIKASIAANSGTSWQGRIEMFGGDDKVYPIFMRTAPFRDEGKSIIGIIWNFTDISEQIKVEAKLHEYTRRIENDLDEKKETLQKATLLQKSFIQKTIPLLRNFNIHALFMPCENLGGDFFRVLQGFDEKKMIIIIGDCTDHGIKASMDASLLSSLVDKNLGMLYDDNRTDLFLAHISREFMKVSDEDQYPTMFAMIINTRTGETFYSNANSELPYIVRKNKIEKIEKTEGMHIGYLDDPVYERKHIVFKPNDKMFFYSDAIIDIEKKDHSRFGHNGLEKLIDECKGNCGNFFQSLVNKIKEENGHFPLNDDTTLIQIEFMKPLEKEYQFNNLEEWQIYLQEMKSTMKDLDYSHDEIEKLGIALDEMCINAFTHGNKEDTGKAVSITEYIDCKEVIIAIEDEGEGFDPDSITDPVANLETIMERDIEEEFTHGRGIWITKDFLDSVAYNEKGNKVTLIKWKKQKALQVE